MIDLNALTLTIIPILLLSVSGEEAGGGGVEEIFAVMALKLFNK